MLIAMAHEQLKNLKSLQEARDKRTSETLTLDVLSHHQRLARSAAAGESSHPSEHSDFPTFHQLVQADSLYQPAGPPLPREEHFQPLHLLNFYGTSQVKKQKCKYEYSHAGLAQWGIMPGPVSDHHPSPEKGHPLISGTSA